MENLKRLNHNVKIGDKIYHIQTERLNNENIVVTQIFNDDHVIYSKKINLLNKTEEEIKKTINSTHKQTLIY